ncbi:Hypothetical predicted protein [Octopus vulgaris]|uniref:Uncharacterized protein n=1 Tax=Octopus vulgaris TaxID=6645 RepID=A0AA36AMT8_OCTVU|nr:Hypothetical predicted protein [Octopus vulgaris]
MLRSPEYQGWHLNSAPGADITRNQAHRERCSVETHGFGISREDEGSAGKSAVLRRMGFTTRRCTNQSTSPPSSAKAGIMIGSFDCDSLPSTCSFRAHAQFPQLGHCVRINIVYKCGVETHNSGRFYKGAPENPVKLIITMHKHSFSNPRLRFSTSKSVL